MSTRKYCIVPKCTNTSISTPEKLFFNVPRDPKVRKKWCNVMKRDDKIPLSCHTTRFCCEDHFDVEADMENYVKYKLVGGNLKLKKGVLPHKFDCQKPQKNTAERAAFKKRQDIEYFERVLSKNVEHENLIPDPIELIEIEDDSKNDPHDSKNDPLSLPENVDELPESQRTSQKTKGVQVNIKEAMKNKFTNTPSLWKQTKNKKVKSIEININESFTSDSGSLATSSSFKDIDADIESRDLEFIKCANEISFKEHMQKGALMAVSREPKLLLGIPNHSQCCLEHFQKFVSLSNLQIMVTLRKIRWHEPNTMLAIHFGVSESSICKYIQKAIPKIAQCMKELIFFPPTEEVRNNLPIQFRKRYSKVTSIIDCFEVQIEKPSNATHQALTWSQYKNCNTIKFLISITPDGLINFISEGYGGRTSDSTIFEDCGFLDELTPGSLVLADRGFKNIAHLLEQKQCKLVRPPSVSSNSKPTKEEVLQTKKIAALRVHVERSIGRLRDFQMVGPHATVDISYIQLLDDIVAIACGIVNLQDCLFKGMSVM